MRVKKWNVCVLSAGSLWSEGSCICGSELVPDLAGAVCDSALTWIGFVSLSVDEVFAI